MAGKSLSRAGYQRLLRDLRGALEGGRRRAQEAVASELAQTYWVVGDRLVNEKLTRNAGYGDAVVRELSLDLEVDQSTLRRAVSFRQAYPKAPTAALSWTHFRELLSVPDAAERQFYQGLALEGDLSSRQLRDAIRSDTFAAAPAGGAKATRKRAAPQRPTDASYLNRARVLRVIDGDSLLLLVDLGFSSLSEVRTRLARIDAPDIKTVEGRSARNYLEAKLAAFEEVVVTTEKTDLHGRYVAHIFYAPSGSPSRHEVFAKGRYLNAELVRAGHAKPV